MRSRRALGFESGDFRIRPSDNERVETPRHCTVLFLVVRLGRVLSVVYQCTFSARFGFNQNIITIKRVVFLIFTIIRSGSYIEPK